MIAEKLVPFLDVFNYDPRNAKFLGDPIDFIVFEDDEIILIEVKTNKSRLTSRQKMIKKLTLNKKVRWEEIRIK